MANIAWEQDSNYSDHRYGVEKILWFSNIDVTAQAGVQARITLTEDIVITEAGSYITTQVSANSSTTLLIRESASETNIVTISHPTSTNRIIAVGDAFRSTSISSEKTAVNGSVLTVETAVSATDAGIVTVYVKYRSVFN